MAVLANILLAILLVVTIILHSSTLAVDSSHQYGLNTEWRQPVDLHQLYPTPISKHEWQFDFTPIEEQIYWLKLDNQNQLIIDTESAPILAKIVSSLPANLDQRSLSRLSFLLAQGFPSTAGKELGGLTIQYYHYHHAALAIEKENEESGETEERFEKITSLQYHYLGSDYVEKIFGPKIALKRYLFARKRVLEDQQLNTKEKQERLSELSQQYSTEHGSASIKSSES